MFGSSRLFDPMLDPRGLYFGAHFASKIAGTHAFGRLKIALEASPRTYLAPRPPGGLQGAPHSPLEAALLPV